MARSEGPLGEVRTLRRNASRTMGSPARRSPENSEAVSQAGPVGSDRAGTRTQDQRINLPHRLSPTPGTVGSAPGVARLDSPIAITGVPRRVSGAGPGDPPAPLPADCPIPRTF